MKNIPLLIILLALFSSGCSVYQDKEAASRDLKNTYQGVRSINNSLEHLRDQIAKNNALVKEEQFSLKEDRSKGKEEINKSLSNIKKDLSTLKITQAKSLKEVATLGDTLQRMISNLEEYNYRVTSVSKRIESIDSRISQLGEIYKKISENEEVRLEIEKAVASDHDIRWKDLGQLSISLQGDLAEMRVLIDSISSSTKVKGVQANRKKKPVKKSDPTASISFPAKKKEKVLQNIEILPKGGAETTSREKTAPPLVSSAPDELFKVAYKDYLNGSYNLSIAGFQSFIAAYPTSERNSSARYWVGESYYSEGKYKDAIEYFSEVIKIHPTSMKASSALLKMAYSNLNLKQTEQAVTLMKKLLEEYPNSGETELAKDKLKLLGELDKDPG